MNLVFQIFTDTNPGTKKNPNPMKRIAILKTKKKKKNLP